MARRRKWTISWDKNYPAFGVIWVPDKSADIGESIAGTVEKLNHGYTYVRLNSRLHYPDSDGITFDTVSGAKQYIRKYLN